MQPVTLDEELRWATQMLEAAGVAEARLAAEALLLHVLQRPRSFLYGHGLDYFTPPGHARFEELLRRRAEGEPVQYILGFEQFYGRNFLVSPSVLIPRPETELSVQTVLELASPLPVPSPLIADICTGSGCIAITLALELPRARVVAADISGPALTIAARNASELQAPVEFREGDLLEPWRDLAGGFDLIVANPPYVGEDEFPHLQREVRDFEPRTALIGGPHGTEIYQRLIAQAAEFLKPGGWLVLEIGYRSAARLRSLLTDWEGVEVIADWQGWDRVIKARKTSGETAARATK